MLLVQAGDTSSGLTFVIGGPHGTGDAVKQRADRILRLSSMVLNHQVIVVNVVLSPRTTQQSALVMPLLCAGCTCRTSRADLQRLDYPPRGAIPSLDLFL